MFQIPCQDPSIDFAEPNPNLLDGEDALDNDQANRRLRAAYLQNEQLSARVILIPYFVIIVLASTLVAASAIFNTIDGKLVISWAAAVVVAVLISWRGAVVANRRAGGRTPQSLGHWWTIEAAGLALLWVSLPLYGLVVAPQSAQPTLAAAIGVMAATSFTYIAVPTALSAWLGIFVLALAAGTLSGSVRASLGLTLGALLLAVVAGMARLSRLVFGQLSGVAKTRAEAESIRQLLNEYEHRGVGWLWQVDSENRVVYISSRMTALIGRSTNQLVGHSLPAALGGTSALGRILLSRQPFANLEMELTTRRGTRWISLSGDPIIDMGGQFQGFRGVGQDVTDVRRTQERLTNLANMDVLSGLPNRGRVRQLLGEALSSSAGGDTPCAILFLDLDGFKPVNDTFGHPKGDAVLKSVAQRLVKVVGPFGHVGRMGGDEFAIVIRDARGKDQIENLAERLIAAIAEPFCIDKLEIRIGVSIGCAFGPVDGGSVDDLIQKADLALYQAKNQGRGICCFFSSDLKNQAEDRLLLEHDLRQALSANQLVLLYQPLISTEDQSLVGFEAVLRWDHPTRGIVPPNQFIPVAEDSSLIMEMGEWVIEEACRAATHWPGHISVAVNISPRQLIAPALPNILKRALQEYSLLPSRLELEVTESVFFGDSANAIDVLKQLRALGVLLALDDFGTGYSSLGYLNKAVFDKLKIDGSFVREAGINKETVAIIQSIVQLAKSFRMTVTAEGVETADDFTRMRDLGCHQIQGYLFGRPMSFEKASELVTGTVRLPETVQQAPIGQIENAETEYGPSPDRPDSEQGQLAEPDTTPGTEVATQGKQSLADRAYNYWVSLKGDRSFPSIADIDPPTIGDFGPHTILLDVTRSARDAEITFLGQALRIEIGIAHTVRTLREAPIRSLLSRLSDHFTQVVGTGKPVGFQAEFISRRGRGTLYRGILMPLGSDRDTVDFVLGVINWRDIEESDRSEARLTKKLDEFLGRASGSPDVSEKQNAIPPSDSNDVGAEAFRKLGPGEAAQRKPFSAFVEDEEMATTLRSIARGMGWPADGVLPGGLDAARHAVTGAISAKVFFVDLAGVDGSLEQIGEFIAACAEDTRVVACGESDDIPTYRALLRLGLVDYLPKPVTKGQLYDALAEAGRHLRLSTGAVAA